MTTREVHVQALRAFINRAIEDCGEAELPTMLTEAMGEDLSLSAFEILHGQISEAFTRARRIAKQRVASSRS